MTKYYVELPEDNRIFVAQQVKHVATWYKRSITNMSADCNSNTVLIDKEDFIFCDSLTCVSTEGYERLELTRLLTKGVPAPEPDYSKWAGLPVWVRNVKGMDYELRLFESFSKAGYPFSFLTKKQCWKYCKLATKEELQDWMDKLQDAQ